MYHYLGGDVDSFNQTARRGEYPFITKLTKQPPLLGGYVKAFFYNDGVAEGARGEGQTGGEGTPITKTQGSEETDQDKTKTTEGGNGYLNYEWSGLQYNEAAFHKVKDYYFNAGCKHVETKIKKGDHDIKMVSPEIEERLKLADKADEYQKALKELKKGNQLDPEKFNQATINELESVKKREAENLKLQEEKYTQVIAEKENEINGMKQRIVEEAIASRLRPKLITPDNQNDAGMQIAYRSIVKELSSQVEIQDDLGFKIISTEKDGDEPVYLDKSVEGKVVDYTIDDLCMDFLKNSPIFTQATDMKSGAGTRVGSQGKGNEEIKLFSWQGQEDSSDWTPRNK